MSLSVSRANQRSLSLKKNESESESEATNRHMERHHTYCGAYIHQSKIPHAYIGIFLSIFPGVLELSFPEAWETRGGQ